MISKNTASLAFAILLFTASCDTGSSLKSPEDQVRVQEIMDSLQKKVEGDFMKKDTASLSVSPLKIVRYRLSKNSIGVPEITLSLKNATDKTIDGIKIGVYCFNNFDEPVSGGLSNVYRGIAQEKVRPGKTVEYTWTMNLFSGTTKVYPYVMQVHFTDGTLWDNDEKK